MRILRTGIAVLLLGSIVMLQDAQAQATGFGIGPKAGLYLKGHPMIGVQADYPISRNWGINPALEVIFPGNSTTTIEIDGTIRYGFPVRGETYMPYVFAGPALAYSIVTLGNETATETTFGLAGGGAIIWNTRDDLQWWTGIKINLFNGDSDVLLQGGATFYL